MIRIRHVAKEYDSSSGPIRALSGISLDVADGQFVAIVGKSGCGKSTLLKILGGIEQPTAGSVELERQAPATRLSEYGFCFQDPTLLPWLSVIENVLLPYRLTHSVDGEARRRAVDLLRTVGVGDFEGNYPWELSGGMQSRVALCRALVHGPRVLLLDEPFAALDALTRETLLYELQAIWLRDRPSTFLVTHSIFEAVMLSDVVLVMTERPGRVELVVPIELPRPRRADHQYLPAFQEYERQIKTLIFRMAV